MELFSGFLDILNDDCLLCPIHECIAMPFGHLSGIENNVLF